MPGIHCTRGFCDEEDEEEELGILVVGLVYNSNSMKSRFEMSQFACFLPTFWDLIFYPFFVRYVNAVETLQIGEFDL